MSAAVGSNGGPGAGTTEARGAEILADLRARKLRWVEIFYTDLMGGYNHLHMPVDALEPDSFVTGIPKLDGSSVRGFREIYESDMVLLPDPSTFATIPWGSAGSGSAR
ncbi:MAG TPA: glutamine synthetase, partial [Thermoplasmata archaeon]|nr:glutamine synthetase [Thermoplasmata archaeon]